MNGHPLLAAHASLAPVRCGGRGHMLNLFLRGYFKRRLGRMVYSEAAVAEIRRRMESLAARARVPCDDLAISATEIAGVPVEVIEPRALSGPAPVVLYFHGGVFLAGSARTHRGITTWLARQLGIAAERVMRGAELADLNPDALREVTRDVSVFARVAPEHTKAIAE